MSKAHGRRRAPGEGSIYRRQDGRWVAVIDEGFVNGKRKRTNLYGKTKGEVGRKMREAQMRMTQGLAPMDSNETLEGWTHYWLDNIVDISDRADSTKRSYRDEMVKHVLPALGRHRLKDLDTGKIQSWVSGLAKARTGSRSSVSGPGSGGPSNNTIRIRLSALSSCLAVAVEQGKIARNPTDGVRGPAVRRNYDATKPLSSEEVKKFLTEARKHDLAALWFIYVTCGLRRGEALGLQWGDIDLENRTLKVRRSLNRLAADGPVMSNGKSPAAQREVPIPNGTAALLREHREEQQTKLGSPVRPGDFVFTTRTGRPVSPRNVDRAFKGILERAGVQEVNLHRLRHTYVALLRRLPDVDRTDISKALGHSTVNITAAMYAFPEDRMQRKMADKLDEFLF